MKLPQSVDTNDSMVARKRLAVSLAPGMRGYERGWLVKDIVAGMTLAAYAIPVSLAYATLAGLPPHYGIYCYMVGGLGYALFGSSRQLAIGPTSAIAMLVGTTIAPLAAGDADRAVSIAGLTALLVAGICFIAWLVRLSGLMSFISETILLGFKAGAALTIALTQLPKLFGLAGGGEDFFSRLWILASQLPETNWLVLGFGLAALACLLLGEKFFPGRPVALVVVALSIVAVSATSLGEMNFKIVGDLPGGLPQLILPSLHVRDVDGVIPLACACFLLSYIESDSAARTLAEKNGYRVDSRQELLGLGAANFCAAFVQGFPIAGGLSQSAVNDKAGAKSSLALVIASVSLAGCLLFLTGFLRNLPTVVLAAIVLVAVRGLIDFSAIVRLRRISRFEFRISMVALAGVLLLGILNGVLLAAVVSLLTLIASAARPSVAFLGRIPGTQRFSDIDRHRDNQAIPGVLVFRVEASFLYFNAEHIRQTVLDRIDADPQLKLVVCDLSNSPYVDVAGANMLSALHRDLAKRGIVLRLAEARSRVRVLLRSVGLEEQVGYFGRHETVQQAIAQFEQALPETSPG